MAENFLSRLTRRLKETYKGSESGTPMAADIGSDLLALLSAALSYIVQN